MGLEETIAQEAKNIQVNKFSGLRPEVRALEEKKDKIKNSHDRLQDLSGLQPKEVRDFIETKKVIEKVLRENKAVLAEKGITDKKGIIEAYSEDEDVEKYKESHQKLKSTAKGILEERKVLKEEGIKNIRGEEAKSEVEEKIKSFDEEINAIKKRTPEAKRFIENFRKESIINGLRSIDDINFIKANQFKEAREHGFSNEEIKQIIKDGFSSEEGIKSLRENYREITSTTDKKYDYQQIRDAEKKVKLVEAQLEAKINMDLAKAEKEIFYDDNKVGEIENEEENMKKKINEKIEEYSEIIQKINGKVDWKDKIVFGEEILPENWEEKLKKIDIFNKLDKAVYEVDKAINEWKKSEPKMFKGKWETQLNELENKRAILGKERGEQDNATYHDREFKKAIDGLEVMIKNIGVTEELMGREMTLFELQSFLHEKKFSLYKEGLPQEKKEVLKNWRNLEKAFDLALNNYKSGSYKNNIY